MEHLREITTRPRIHPSHSLRPSSAIEPSVSVRCTRCLYDETTPSITFDGDGVCNYCKIHDDLAAQYPTGASGEQRLREVAEVIKKKGRKKPFDVVVGVSGGCDSSFLLYKAKELGLRPLAVHFDNTWNTTTAVENIQNVLNALDVQLYTYVVDNEEYDDIYRSFLKAGVPDLEAPTDIALAATLYKAAEQYGIKYIFEGHSFRTEGISPLGWLYMDAKYIANVQKTYGTHALDTYPNLWLHAQLRWMVARRIKKIRPLWFIDYPKEEVKAFLTKEFGWKWYGGHHLENRFTSFYHSYFLPRRFGIDQRLNGYSALVRSGQMTRTEGLALLQEPPHLESGLVELVKKRLGFSDDEFEHLMTQPKKTYCDFKTYKRTFERLRPFFWVLAEMDLIPKSFYIKYTSKNNI
ncbi:MAG: N-acetyl sugar amidotransferase [Rhodothermales bacterium]